MDPALLLDAIGHDFASKVLERTGLTPFAKGLNAGLVDATDPGARDDCR